MYNPIIVHKRRTNTVTVSLGIDVSNDVLSSEIRAKEDVTSTLIATWDIAYATDGKDGELVLTLDDSITSTITASSGYMDIKRITGNEPVSIFDKPLKVTFRGTVTE